MNMKRFVVAVLALCLVLCLCACGGSSEGTAATTEATKAAGNTVTKPTEAETEPANTNVDFTVKVVDFNGNPVEGARVQLCVGELCKTPATTNAEGVVTFSFPDDYYTVKVSDIPANMQAPAVEEHVSADEPEVTIELKQRVLNYAVKVTDEGGNAVTMVTVQFQNENLSEVKTNAEGEASVNGFAVIPGIILTEIPEGYTADVTEYAFDDTCYNAEEDVYEISVTLKAVA